MKPLRKKRLARVLPAEPRKQYYDPKTGVMTLHAPGEPITFGGALDYAMQRLGGEEGFSHWAAYNAGHFYTLMARKLPIELAGKDGGPIEVTFTDPVALGIAAAKLPK